MTASHRPLAVALALLVMTAGPAGAQDTDTGASRRVAFDTVIAYQDFFAEDADWPAQFIVDVFSAAEIGPGWQVSVRPKLWRYRGEWRPLLDQASVRYEFRRGANWRVEMGKFSSPVGLDMTENRSNVNPGVIWWHRPYYMPLPSQGVDVPRVSLASAVYPWGALVSASRAHWDVRAGVVDRPPVAFWRREPGDALGANRIIGAGVTPRQGLRIGAAHASGRFADATASRPALDYEMISAEADVAFGHSRISGEWVRSRFESAAADRLSEGWTAQVQHGVTPRVFAHTRMSVVRAPRAANALAPVTVGQRYRSIDSTLGYRVSPEATLRLAHSAIRGFGQAVTDHQLGVSVVWTRRWW